MKLILTTDVASLGAPGDIVEVKDGYGRNLPAPAGQGHRGHQGAEKQIATIKRAQFAREIRGTEHAKEVKTALEALTDHDHRAGHRRRHEAVRLDHQRRRRGRDQGRRRPVRWTGTSVDTGGHIKTVGKHPVSVKLHPGVVASFEVTVVTS